MAHAKASDLLDIESLLNDLRALPSLREKSNACFYLKSKSVLHFHIKGERRYIHVFDSKGWVEIDVPKPVMKKELKLIYTEIIQVLNYI